MVYVINPSLQIFSEEFVADRLIKTASA